MKVISARFKIDVRFCGDMIANLPNSRFGLDRLRMEADASFLSVIDTIDNYTILVPHDNVIQFDVIHEESNKKPSRAKSRRSKKDA